MRLSWPTQAAGGRIGVLPSVATPLARTPAPYQTGTRTRSRAGRWMPVLAVSNRYRCRPGDGGGRSSRGQLLPEPFLWRCLAALRTRPEGVTGALFGLSDGPFILACSIW